MLLNSFAALLEMGGPCRTLSRRMLAEREKWGGLGLNFRGSKGIISSSPHVSPAFFLPPYYTLGPSVPSSFSPFFSSLLPFLLSLFFSVSLS